MGIRQFKFLLSEEDLRAQLSELEINSLSLTQNCFPRAIGQIHLGLLDLAVYSGHGAGTETFMRQLISALLEQPEIVQPRFGAPLQALLTVFDSRDPRLQFAYLSFSLCAFFGDKRAVFLTHFFFVAQTLVAFLTDQSGVFLSRRLQSFSQTSLTIAFELSQIAAQAVGRRLDPVHSPVEAPALTSGFRHRALTNVSEAIRKIALHNAQSCFLFAQAPRFARRNRYKRFFSAAHVYLHLSVIALNMLTQMTGVVAISKPRLLQRACQLNEAHARGPQDPRLLHRLPPHAD